MFSFQKRYFILFILLLITEILIALFVHDKFVRPYVGDVLVVMMLYCGVKTFVKNRVLPIAFGVLLFSYFVELLQYFNFVELIGLQNSRFANVVLGNYFTWADIVAYTIGALIVILLEGIASKVKA